MQLLLYLCASVCRLQSQRIRIQTLAHRYKSSCILQANRYFSRNVRGKVAILVRETALCYWKWYKRDKGPLSFRDTRFTVQEIAFVCMEVRLWLASWSCDVSAFDTRLQAQVVAGCNCNLLSLRLKHVCLLNKVVLLTCTYHNCFDS